MVLCIGALMNLLRVNRKIQVKSWDFLKLKICARYHQTRPGLTLCLEAEKSERSGIGVDAIILNSRSLSVGR